MWRAVSCLLMIAGCNQLFDLHETDLIPGLDARIRGCVAQGETPMFTTAPVPLTTGPFPFDYTFDEAKTFAVADVVNDGIAEGPPDTMDLTVIDFPRDAGDALFGPRLSPEGDELFVQVRDASNNWTLRAYTRTGPRTYVRGPTLASIPNGPYEAHSTPSRRAGGRRMFRRSSIGQALTEYEEVAPSAWSVVRSYSAAELAVPVRPGGIETPQLSPDGLRLIFKLGEPAENPVYYTDRPTVTSSFGPARRMFALPGDANLVHPFLAPDCVRLYFIAFPGLNYVEQ